MKRSIFPVSLAATLFLSSVLVSAQSQDNPPNLRRQGPQNTGPMAPAPPRQSLREQLGLTDLQQTDIRKAMENARRDRLRKSTDLKIARLDLMSLLREEKVDEKAIAAKLAEATAAQGTLFKLRVDSALAMKRILTPEQQKKLAEIRADRGRPRMGQRMRMRGMPGFGRAPMGPGARPGMPGGGAEFDFDLEDEGLELIEIDGVAR